MTTLHWRLDQVGIDWNELLRLYRIAPLGEKKPEHLQSSFTNSRFKCFVFSDGALVGAGRALADGAACSYTCDVAVHPDYQGRRLGKAIVSRLRDLSTGHRKIILYANPGKEDFYRKLGFLRMRTARAVFQDQENAGRSSLVDET